MLRTGRRTVHGAGRRHRQPRAPRWPWPVSNFAGGGKERHWAGELGGWSGWSSSPEAGSALLHSEGVSAFTGMRLEAVRVKRSPQRGGRATTPCPPASAAAEGTLTSLPAMGAGGCLGGSAGLPHHKPAGAFTTGCQASCWGHGGHRLAGSQSPKRPKGHRTADAYTLAGAAEHHPHGTEDEGPTGSRQGLVEPPGSPLLTRLPGRDGVH